MPSHAITSIPGLAGEFCAAPFGRVRSSRELPISMSSTVFFVAPAVGPMMAQDVPPAMETAVAATASTRFERPTRGFYTAPSRSDNPDEAAGSSRKNQELLRSSIPHDQ
jgi:hypothetical protein